MKAIITLIFIIVFLGGVYFITDYKDFHNSINEALYSKNKSGHFFSIKQIIGGSEYNKKAVYFILNDANQVVGVRLNKGIFGWKLSGSATATGFEINQEQEISKLSIGSSQETDKYYFGLTAYENVAKVIINQNVEAELINLKEHVIDDNENTFLWYANINDKEHQSYFSVEIFDDQNKLIAADLGPNRQ